MTSEPGHAPGVAGTQFRVGPLSMDPHRIIYASILLMTAYSIYDEGTDPLGTSAHLDLVTPVGRPI